MSQKYSGGFITKSPVAPTSSAASGIWTLDQQQQAKQAGNWPSPPIFIEDVFSCFLYTGNGTSQTITNGIDLSGQGGLVWTKDRNSGANHQLFDTSRGLYKRLATNSTAAEFNYSPDGLTAFNANGFTMTGNGDYNSSGYLIASWTFREQPKFFDIVTWTGDGTAGRTVAHNLGSVPGSIFVKCTSFAAGGGWPVYHRSLGNTQTAVLNTTDAAFTYGYWNNTTPTSTVFTLNSDSDVNGSGRTYVAYLFAHDAGGFGLTGTDNVISCGSFTTVGSGKMSAPVNLGYEPQWLMIKNSGAVENWTMYDIMRGLSYGGYKVLYPSLSNAEDSSATPLVPTATGFDTPTASGPFANFSTYIYIAIRRGPMKTPTVGTSVFDPETYTGNATARSISGLGFPPDLVFPKIRDNGSGFNGTMTDRLRGATVYLIPNDTSAEATNANYVTVLGQDGFSLGSGADVNRSTSTFISWNFRRAPGFFDEVCYTGVGGTATFSHNLTVIPELLIIKRRSAVSSWPVLYNFVGSNFDKLQGLNQDGNAATNTYTDGAGLGGAPTATTFTVDSTSTFNGSGSTFVAYLFATCAGVSKVGSYTGNGSSQTIACGFTAGSRFVLIKRTDSTGDWYVWDSARGIVPGNDPHLSLNDTAAEVTTDDSVDTDNTGFIVNQVAATNINVTSAAYIFLAIA